MNKSDKIGITCVVVVSAFAVWLFGWMIYDSERELDTPKWHLEYEPTTDQEREQVANHVQKILGATPSSLAGNDQDWDDAIKTAHQDAKRLFCKPTLWEYVRFQKTGHWKPITP